MWIERIRAVAFGPLVAEELEFGPGMNVVIGPNEIGKVELARHLVRCLVRDEAFSGRTPCRRQGVREPPSPMEWI